MQLFSIQQLYYNISNSSVFFLYRFYFIDATAVKEIESIFETESIDTADGITKPKKFTLKEKINLANSLREACLPKLLCEIAAKPANKMTEKEQSLLELIK